MTTNPDDELRAENALIKLKLEVDHGMQASHFAGELPPALENAWLNSILDFEKQWKQTPAVSVFSHLGQPKFRTWDTLPLAEIRRETRRLLDLMKSRSIVLESLKPVDDLEYYRFITEELFKEELAFVPGTSMIVHIIYEEFKDRDRLP